MLRLIGAAVVVSVLASGAPARAQDVDFAAEVAAMRARIESLEAEVATLKARPAVPEPVPAAPPPPAPRDNGWSVKPIGRLQYDAAYVESPAGTRDRGLGFANELRRARIGVEGTIPGGFGFKAEVDFADNQVEITDAYLTWQASKRIGLTLGQHNNFQSLEELTSSRFLSFLERAAFTDAFNFERRVGLSARYAGGDLIASAGVFTDNIEDLSGASGSAGLGDENDAVSADARIVYAPKAGSTQLHLGGSVHHRDNGDGLASDPATRYRQRPFVHTTDTRFLATPGLRVDSETDYGVEAGLIAGPLHAAGEVHWLRSNTATPGLGPTFFGGYAELGYFLTGESRGYKGGRWDRTKVRNPLGEGGGIGAFQINLRYDHLDLISGPISGGRQNGYQASLIWIPQDNVRFLLNYAHLRYDEAAVAAAGGDRDYGIDVFGARAQIDW